MSYVIQQRDIDIIRQSNKNMHVKLELLNSNIQIIDQIEGLLISDSISINADSDIRRAYSCELFVRNSSLLVGINKMIWLDKYIRPYIGITHQRTNQIAWYLMGTYVFNDTGYAYEETSRTLSLTCSDLMCTLNGDRGGQVEGLSTKIEEGSYVRNVMVSLLEEAGIKKYRVEDIQKFVPYDLEFGTGVTYYKILKQLLELYAGYEMFFDVYGVFVIQKIPTTQYDEVKLDESLFSQLVKSEQINNSFNKIYNVTQVWSSTIEPDRYTSTVTVSGNQYRATFQDLPKLDNFEKYGIRIPTVSGNQPTLNLNNLGARPIMDDNGSPIPAGRLLANTDYVFKYRKASEDFILLGQYQAYGEYKMYDEDCPYSITRLGKEIKQVLNFNEIYSDSLCEQRAKYETWLATRRKDSVTLNMIIIPFLDVNWKISYESVNTKKKSDYIIKSISGSTNEGLMTVEMIIFSELYPDIV